MKGLKKLFRNRNFMVVFSTIIGTFIYCIGIVFLLDLTKFYAGGITGISQLIVNLTGSSIVGLKSIIIILFNIPLLLIAWRGVSRRFAILSVVSIGLQSLFIFIFEYFQTLGFNPFVGLKNDPLAIAILGGLVTGAGCGISLKHGSSTGGLDIISQYLSLKKHISFAKFSLLVDLSIIGIAAIFQDVSIASYTIIRLIITVLVLDKIHTTYKYGRITIITEEKQRMRDAIMKHFKHGITIYQATGGYTNKPKYVIVSTIYTFESQDFIDLAKEIDPLCFITFSQVARVDGNYNIQVVA